MPLPACFALSGADIAYRAMPLPACYAMSSTDAVCLRACYAMSGTYMPYRGTRLGIPGGPTPAPRFGADIGADTTVGLRRPNPETADEDRPWWLCAAKFPAIQVAHSPKSTTRIRAREDTGAQKSDTYSETPYQEHTHKT
eukprot:2215512-Rhodomonas_salina.1